METSSRTNIYSENNEINDQCNFKKLKLSFSQWQSKKFRGNISALFFQNVTFFN